MYETFDHVTFCHCSCEFILLILHLVSIHLQHFLLSFFAYLSYWTTQMYWYSLCLLLFLFSICCFICCHFVCSIAPVKLWLSRVHIIVLMCYLMLMCWGFWTGCCLKECCISGVSSVPICRWRSGPLIENDTQLNSYLPILSPGVCHELIQFLQHSIAFWISGSGQSLQL
jgi:hypothetical protein